MRTLVDIDDRILNEAMNLTGIKTKKETLHRALEELVKLKFRENLIEMAGSGTIEMTHKQLKRLRGKRTGSKGTITRKANA